MCNRVLATVTCAQCDGRPQNTRSLIVGISTTFTGEETKNENGRHKRREEFIASFCMKALCWQSGERKTEREVGGPYCFVERKFDTTR